MKKTDLFQETLLSLSANKSRSVLTILGIVIGIGSVITMISIGQGAAADISSQIQSLGSNLLVVSPGSANSFGAVRGTQGSATTLVNSDAEAIASQIQNIDALAPTVSSRKQVIAGGNNTNTSIYGVSAEYAQVKNLALANGTFINATHNEKLSKIAVLGPDVSEELFGEGVDPIAHFAGFLRFFHYCQGLIGQQVPTRLGAQHVDAVGFIDIDFCVQRQLGQQSAGQPDLQLVAGRADISAFFLMDGEQ